VRAMKFRGLQKAGHLARVKGATNAHNILVVKPLEKCPNERLRSRWECNIKMDVGEMSCEHGRWMELTEKCVQWQALVMVVIYSFQIIIFYFTPLLVC
jgi:hypothetical protein